MLGVMGKILWVDLTTGDIRDERLPAEMYEQYVGGYGIGARLLYDRMPANADPLGPANIFGIVTGPLTGTTAVTGNRFTAIGKSPKTHTWGDANCGGTFGPALKFAGYDGVFVTGASEKPVYLLIDEGQASLHDASDVWNKGDDLHPERVLKERHGRKFEVAWIGRAGETMSLTAGVMNDIGRSAARSGLGAVMGAKKLKAIVTGGSHQIPLHDAEGLRLCAAGAIKDAKTENSPTWQAFSEYGTTGGVAASAASGDSPVKNWAGVGIVDFTDAYAISDVALDDYKLKRTGCWHCNIACSAHMRVPEGKYAVETHRPEYETLAAAGTMTLSNDIEAMHKFNDVCNFYGMDTITTGSIIAYAMEAYERGYLNGVDTDGIELAWGNSDAVVEMAKKLGRREGRLGEIFGDGVAKAAERLGAGAEEFAVHVHGEEVPMHDPRLAPGLSVTYQVDATPGRHTQGGTGLLEMGGEAGGPIGGPEKYNYGTKGPMHRMLVNAGHLRNAAGVCMFAEFVTAPETLADELRFATGIDWTYDRIQEAGERIAVIRHAFNLREGLNPATFEMPKRILDGRSLGAGPLKDVNVDVDAERTAYFEAAGWDPKTSVPSVESLERLGLHELVADLHAGA